MPSSVVATSSAGNLNAIAQRGAREVKPSSSCKNRSSILATLPSASNSSVWRISVIFAWYAVIPATPSTVSNCLEIGKPSPARYSSNSAWVFTGSPRCEPTAYKYALRLRLAVTLESFWRSVPAAALRGFLKAGSAFSSSSALMRANSARLKKTSPRTSRSSGSVSSLGISGIVSTLCVTSSPVSPSPRVAAQISLPARYRMLMLKPSIFSSHV